MTDETPDLPTEEERIATEAKKGFSLRDRLLGIKQAESKVLLFLDLGAVVKYGEAKREHNLLKAKLLGNTDGEQEGPNAKTLKDSEKALDKLKAAMLAESLAVSLRSVPNIAIKAAQREARKAYAVDGKIPDESFEFFAQKINSLTLVDVITGITDSSGETLKPTIEDIEQLENLLPSTQWDVLNAAVNKLIYRDTVGEQATDEPGF